MHRGARIFARRRRSLGREAGPGPQSIGGIQAVAAVTAHMSLSQPIEPVTTRRKPAVCRCVGLTGTSRSPLAKVVDNDGRLFSTEFVGVYRQSWGGAPPRYAHPSREFARHKKGRQNRSTSVGNQKFESISLRPGRQLARAFLLGPWSSNGVGSDDQSAHECR